MRHQSVTVVGAGAWGVWTAYFLQLSGYTVTLVDRWGAGNSNSGSGGETRIIRTVYGGDELYTQMAHRSFELWHKYLPFWGANLYHQRGSLWLSSEKHNYITDSQKPMQELGYPLHEIGMNDARIQYPHINFTGIDSVYYEPICGYLEARNACRKVLEEFEKLGGTFIVDQVEHIQSSDKINGLVTGGHGKLESDYFIFACGSWITSLFPMLQSHIYISRQEVFFFQDELLRSYGQIPMWLEFQEDGDMYYGISDHFNRGFKISYDSRNIPFDPENDDRTTTPELLKKMRDYMGSRFPKMKNSKLVETRVCHYENSLDGDYIIDKAPGFENGLILGGTSGHGFKMGPAIGEIVLNYLSQGTELPKRFALNRFQTMKNKKTQFD